MNPAPSSMDVEDMADKGSDEGTETELRFDPSKVPGMDKYQSGDKVTLTVDATMGDVGEDGKADFTVDRIEAEPMEPAKQASRRMMSKKPDMSGTAMEGQSGY